MRKRTRRPASDDAPRFLAELFRTKILFDGQAMSWREAMIRQLYAASLRGDMAAATQLQALRDACGSDGASARGVLVVPEPISAEEWERRAFEQQAKYRERRPDMEDEF